MLALLAPALTVEWIMRGPAHVGQAPRNLRWSADSSLLRFDWAKPDGKAEPSFSRYMVKADGSGLTKATQETPEDQRYDAFVTDGIRRLYSEDGDIFLVDGTTKQLTKGDAFDTGPRFSLDRKAVLFTRDSDFYRMDLATGDLVQLTHVVSPEPAATPANVSTTDSQKALADEQNKLLKGFSPSGQRLPNAGRRTFGGRGGRASSSTGGVALTVPEGFRAGGSTLATGGDFATLEIAKDTPGARVAEVPSYVTRSGFTEMLPTYAKVGDVQTRESLLIFDLKGGAPIKVEPPRPGTVGAVRWSPDGRTGVISLYAEDHKDVWYMAFDTSTKTVRTLRTEHDDAWVGGPSGGFFEWLPNGRLAYVTEVNGYANLWSIKADGSDNRPLIAGNFEVSDLTLDRTRNRFVFVSSDGSPFKRHVDAVAFDGGPITKLADLSADEDATFAVSPNGTHLALVRSSPARPAELWVDGKQVTQTPTAEWLAHPWIEAPIVKVPARDGNFIPAKLYKPKKWRKGGPAVIFVHGAGYLQNVYEGWSHYFREMMFHHLLMERGYAVLDMDYRASAGYGKAWRTAIYRHMGGVDLDDNVDGARYLVKELGVDKKRIGIYGGSYGGFITLMAMFKAPEVFAAGAALRPVTDWAHYNHGYTSNILNFPQTDPEAYRQSSPIYFAEGLRGSLLICHGMVDTNVHFQDTVRLVERLIELGKDNWEVAPYPVENHGFTRPDSWTDEYKRILALFERTIGNKRK